MFTAPPKSFHLCSLLTRQTLFLYILPMTIVKREYNGDLSWYRISKPTPNRRWTKWPHHSEHSISYETKWWLTMKFKLLILIKADYWNLIRPIITYCLNQECQIMGQDLYSWGINLLLGSSMNNLLRQHSVINCPKFNLVRIAGKTFSVKYPKLDSLFLKF